MVSKVCPLLEGILKMQKEEASVNGVLGGYGHVHDADINDS